MQRMDLSRGDRLFPFSSHRKRMTTLIHGSVGGDADGQRVYSKGAAEIVLASCKFQTKANGEALLRWSALSCLETGCCCLVVVVVVVRCGVVVVVVVDVFGDGGAGGVGGCVVVFALFRLPLVCSTDLCVSALSVLCCAVLCCVVLFCTKYCVVLCCVVLSACVLLSVCYEYSPARFRSRRFCGVLSVA